MCTEVLRSEVLLPASGSQWGQSQCDQIIQGGAQPTVKFQYSCAKLSSSVRQPVYGGCRKCGHSDPRSLFRLCRWRQHISPKRLYPVRRYTVSQNPNSAQLTVPISVAACREYLNELPLQVSPIIKDRETVELGDYPHVVSGQETCCYRTALRSCNPLLPDGISVRLPAATGQHSGQITRCYRTAFRSRSQANVQFVWNVNDKYL
jgi:hypothetical protein